MPLTPTFNGLAIFGAAVVVRPVPSANDRQFFSVAGLNGVFSKNLGSRGGRTLVSGILIGATTEDLFVLQQDVRAQMASGVSTTFTDLNGVAWPLTVIESFQPEDMVELTTTADGVGWGQAYSCILFHHI